MNTHILVLINGHAGVGKDTFVKYCTQHAWERDCFVYNFHRSDEPKRALKMLGWDGTKDNESRTLLKAMVDYMESKGTLNKILNRKLSTAAQQFERFILFYHVRDPEVMYNLMDEYIDHDGVKPISLLVKRNLPQPEEPDDWWNIEGAEYIMTVQLPENELEKTQEAAIACVDFLLDSNFKVAKQEDNNVVCSM